MDIYAETKGISENSIIHDLSKELGIAENILQEPKIDKKTNWHQEEINSQLMENKEGYYPFVDQDNGQLFAVNVNIEQNNYQYTIVPETYWINESKPMQITAKAVPSSMLKYPLFNQISLQKTKVSGKPVILTESLLLATDNKKDDTVIWTSWYGEAETADNVDWMLLEERTVYYLLIEYSGIEMDSIYRTALAVYAQLQDVPQINLRYIHVEKASGCQNAIEFLSIKEFLSKAENHYRLELPSKGHARLADELRTGADISQEKKPNHLLFPLIPERSSIMLYAPTEAGKTWFAMSMAYVIAIGRRKFIDVPGWKTTGRQHKVVYIDTELDPGDFAQRYKMIKKIYGKRNEHNFHLLSTLVRPINLSEQSGFDDIDNLLKFIKEEKEPRSKPVSLLVLDNYMNLTDFRDDTGPWKLLMPYIRKLNRSGCSVLIVHHTNKNEKLQKGSYSKNATARNIIKLEKENNFEELARLIEQIKENKPEKEKQRLQTLKNLQTKNHVISMSVFIEKGGDPDERRKYAPIDPEVRSKYRRDRKNYENGKDAKEPREIPRLVLQLDYKAKDLKWEVITDYAHAGEDRNAQILQLHAKNKTCGKIAKAVGLSRQRIHQIIKNSPNASPEANNSLGGEQPHRN
jgi:KaiC/GvpD/RAD55 family RecA-like ATPase